MIFPFFQLQSDNKFTKGGIAPSLSTAFTPYSGQVAVEKTREDFLHTKNAENLKNVNIEADDLNKLVKGSSSTCSSGHLAYSSNNSMNSDCELMSSKPHPKYTELKIPVVRRSSISSSNGSDDDVIRVSSSIAMSKHSRAPGTPPQIQGPGGIEIWPASSKVVIDRAIETMYTKEIIKDRLHNSNNTGHKNTSAAVKHTTSQESARATTPHILKCPAVLDSNLLSQNLKCSEHNEMSNSGNISSVVNNQVESSSRHDLDIEEMLRKPFTFGQIQETLIRKAMEDSYRTVEPCSSNPAEPSFFSRNHKTSNKIAKCNAEKCMVKKEESKNRPTKQGTS